MNLEDQTPIYQLAQGDLPFLVSVPHVGTLVPETILDSFTAEAKRLPDTDWFVDQLFDFPELSRATLIKSNFNRYVIDLNRSTDGENLYPGKPTPELCPTTCFDGTAIYEQAPPDRAEIQRRTSTYWQPYHDQIAAIIADFKARFDFALILDIHSIASCVPRLFDGTLPDFNFGTNHEKSCGRSLNARIREFADSTSEFSAAFNGRFVGGFITRNYGNPGNKIHSVQIEISQATYLDETTGNWDEQKAARVRPVMKEFFCLLSDWIKKT